MPVHPEAQQLLAALAAAGMPPFEHMTVPQAREAAKGFIDLQGEPEDIATEDRTIPGPAGDIPVRVYTPAGDGPKPMIVYFHGGGWVIGDLDVCDNPVRRIANRTGAVVVSVDYRLAPEHVYPAAFDDSYAATAWVAEHAAELGGDPGRIATCGDSAGANLAAAVAIAARDRQGPRLAAQLLLYPVTDFNFTTESYEQNGEGYLLTKGSMQWFWAHYLGAQELGKEPFACPARADDLVGLPPAFVATAEFDPLRDEGEAYAANLRTAGVDVSAKRYDGMLHGFAWTLGATPSGAVLIDDLATALHAVLEGAR
ncbi:alpha/beta hydrolase [Pseudonocardia broussonetiae]|uniref:Alpha/beta hydrolase n=1 Tax=Pseudonocardia broussonetiae TaxID=2736640 RepID=A0A6M6JLB9_9PSEU|nr:alpha/beta hydrolase [Pseudonocardia broussonetiae]QJY47993.1 alpha/beta hydrolase [Pseudonocardia broussonetiae]